MSFSCPHRVGRPGPSAMRSRFTSAPILEFPASSLGSRLTGRGGVLELYSRTGRAKNGWDRPPDLGVRPTLCPHRRVLFLFRQQTGRILTDGGYKPPQRPGSKEKYAKPRVTEPSELNASMCATSFESVCPGMSGVAGAGRINTFLGNPGIADL